ncbi:hypothetical protein SAMN05421847_2566 [Halpernia humi]|uniref:Preprotein translocase subunit SecB n=1 Tax=Halpernia humi TaxID=493375 RepID=A0A1H6ASG0_9FLAO|nr:hypothetical protein [Halpernia humi]SEG51015.1 hypothetical protein SAMN05421847_2566 [Halpernia humi]
MKKEKEKEKKIGFKIIKIQTLEFSFKEVENNIIENLFFENNPIKININFNINIDKDKSEITFDVNSFLPETTENNYVTHSGRTSFKIVGLDDCYEPENDTFQLPDNFMIQLLSISFSHCRALLSVELSSTNFKDKYFLPIIDPAAVFNSTKQNINTKKKS